MRRFQRQPRPPPSVQATSTGIGNSHHHGAANLTIPGGISLSGPNNTTITTIQNNNGNLEASALMKEYAKELESVGRLQSLDGEQYALRSFVLSGLWPFVSLEEDLGIDGVVAKTVFNVMELKETSEKVDYWARNRRMVCKWMDQKRNNTIGAIKKEFIDWVRSIVREGDDVPEWATFAAYRTSARDFEMFELWCDRFFRVSKGSGKFAVLSKNKKVSEIMTVSDEGFVVSILNNGYDRWIAEAKMLESGDGFESVSLPPMRWSEGGASAQKRHRGWKSEGIKFFNETCHEIGSLRNMRHSKELEDKYLGKAKNNQNQKNQYKHRLDNTVKPFCELEFEESVQNDENVIAAIHQVDGLEQVGPVTGV